MLAFKPWRRPPPPEAPEPEAAILLGELERSHQRLLVSMAVVSDIIGGAAPNAALHRAAMVEFAAAKRDRAVTVQKCTNLLAADASPEDATRLKEVREAIQRTQHRSAEHSRKWSTVTIGWNWSRYRPAWSAMRSHWIELIEAEQRLLYPMLRNRAGHSEERSAD